MPGTTATPRQDLVGPPARPLLRSSAGPQLGPRLPRLHRHSHIVASPPTRRAPAWRRAASRLTQQAPAWWHAGLREAFATAPTQQLASQRGATRLVSSDARRGQARRRQLGRASFPSPIKQEGHVGSALNAFVRRCQRIDSSTVHLSTSCVPQWQPFFPIKGGPRRPGEGFGSFGLGTHRS